jgi:hypothetical protein
MLRSDESARRMQRAPRRECATRRQEFFSIHRIHRENKGFRRVAILLRLPRAMQVHAARAIEKAAATKR